MLDGLNFKNTKTYIQSGNVIFQFKEMKYIELEKKIAKKILQEFDFEVPVMVKSLDEINTVLKNNPFVNNRKEDVTKLHVTFLSQEPATDNIDKINKAQYLPDEFILRANTIYLFCPNGYGNTKLSNNFFENKLKVVATTRNWKTINELAIMGENI